MSKLEASSLSANENSVQNESESSPIDHRIFINKVNRNRERIHVSESASNSDDENNDLNEENSQSKNRSSSISSEVSESNLDSNASSHPSTKRTLREESHERSSRKFRDTCDISSDFSIVSLSDTDSSDDSYEFEPSSRFRHVKRRPKSPFFSDNSNSSEPTIKPRRAAAQNVNYHESSEEESDLSFVEEPYTNDGTETVERVLLIRMGRKDDTGSKTAIYNTDNAESCSACDEGEQCEQQFFIKWKGWSFLHCTWESYDSLAKMNAKGIKIVDNYLKRQEEIAKWKKEASPEDIEYHDYQVELVENLFKLHCNVERIIAPEYNRTTGDVEYFCKWQGLPYSDSTWEDGELIRKRFQEKVLEYESRAKCQRIPSKLCKALRSRPKFSPFKEQPDFIGNNNAELRLRDYQLDGVNWLAHAWCKNNSVILADEMGLGKTIQIISFLSFVFNEHNLYGPFLIVVPLSTMHSWQSEFSLWAPQMNVIMYIGDIASRSIVALSAISWSALIVDEAHRLKNDDSLLYKTLINFETNFRILVTGTPLQNSLKELWALLHFIMPERFSDWEAFDKSYSGVLYEGSRSSELHMELEPYLLRRVKRDVEKSLPAKVERILRVEMSYLQKQYYRLIVGRNFSLLNSGQGTSHSYLNIMMELKKCCNHAYLIKREENSSDLQSLIRGSGKLLLLDRLLLRLYETGRRVLIFSQMVRMLDVLSEYLTLRRFPFQRLDGSIKGELRQQALEHFNREDSEQRTFRNDTRAGGLGINLSTADTVIIYDSDWNPHNDLQAEARAHRIGQKKQVYIYRLVTKESVEEDIIERAKRKMVLDHLVIQRMDASGRTVLHKNSVRGSNPFTKEELSAIIKFGAEQLFKGNSGEEKEITIGDIDEILNSAETNEEIEPAAEELLSQFKVANFGAFDEEHLITKSWEEIVPESERDKDFENSEAESFLTPRNRKQLVNFHDPEFEEIESDESSTVDSVNLERWRKRGKPSSPDNFKNFTPKEIRRFVKSFKKFSDPLSRLDAVAADAELQEKSEGDLLALGKYVYDTAHRMCSNTDEMRSTSPSSPCAYITDTNVDKKQTKEKGPFFSIQNVLISASAIVSSIKTLDVLKEFVPESKEERKNFLLQMKLKPVNWDVPWTIVDDSAILLGVFEYGYGNWESMKLDPYLGLNHKILLPNGHKPCSSHLHTRVDYLLKSLSKLSYNTSKAIRLDWSKSRRKKKISNASAVEETTYVKRIKSKKVKAVEREESVNESVTAFPDNENTRNIIDNKKQKVKETSKRSDEKHCKKKKKEYIITGNDDDEYAGLGKAIFEKCKEMMRPAKRALKFLEFSESNWPEKDRVLYIKEHLLCIGDRISDCLCNFNDPDTIKELRSNLWQFVSQFTSWDAEKLRKLYKCFIKKREDEQKQNRHNAQFGPISETQVAFGYHHVPHVKSRSNELSEHHGENRKRRHTDQRFSKRPKYYQHDRRDYKKNFDRIESWNNSGQIRQHENFVAPPAPVIVNVSQPPPPLPHLVHHHAANVSFTYNHNYTSSVAHHSYPPQFSQPYPVTRPVTQNRPPAVWRDVSSPGVVHQQQYLNLPTSYMQGACKSSPSSTTSQPVWNQRMPLRPEQQHSSLQCSNMNQFNKRPRPSCQERYRYNQQTTNRQACSDTLQTPFNRHFTQSRG